MEKEQEIQKMAEIIATGYLPRPIESQFDIFRFKPAAKALQKAGYGDIKQAKQDFADQLYDKLESCALCFGRNPERDAGVYLTDIKQAIKELLEG